MKTISLIFSIFFLSFALRAQEFYLQAGKNYIVVNENGSFYFDDRAATRFNLYKNGDDNYRITTVNYSLNLAVDLNQYNQITFVSGWSWTENSGYFNLEWNSGYGGWVLIKQFSDGRFYLVLANGALKWLSNYSTNIPVILKKEKEATDQAAAEEARRQAAAGEARRRAAAEEARRQAAAEEARRRAAEKNGKIIVYLSNKYNCSKYKVGISPMQYMTNYSGTPPQSLGRDCKAEFKGLPDGDYKVELYILIHNSDGSEDYAKCDGCGDIIDVKYRSKVNIENGSTERVQIGH